jgi:hypothetical protein
VRGDFGLGFGNGWIWQADDRGLGHGRRQKYVHGRAARQPGIADFFCDAQPAIDFHGPGITALHLGELDGVFVALNQRATHAPLA